MEVGGYRFLNRTWYGVKHIGTDWRANHEPFYAPTDGETIASFYGVQMGWQVHFMDSFGYLHRFGHLYYRGGLGKYKKGEILGKTGNSGWLTTNAHLHHDISKNGELELYNIENFLDPEIYFKSKIV